jgi:hypothetical protein
MWVVLYKSTYTGKTWHKVFESRDEASEFMREYVEEEEGTGCLLCRATEGFGSFLYNDDDIPIEMLSNKAFCEAMDKMHNYYQQNNKCRQITPLSESTQNNTVYQNQ